MKATVLTQLNNGQMKVSIMAPKEVRISGKPLSKCTYKEIKDACQAKGMDVAGAQIQDMKDFLQKRVEPKEEKAQKETAEPKKEEGQPQERQDAPMQGEPAYNNTPNKPKQHNIVTSFGEKPKKVYPATSIEVTHDEGLYKHEKVNLLHKQHGMSPAQIAEELDMSVANVRRAIWMHKTGTGIKNPMEL